MTPPTAHSRSTDEGNGLQIKIGGNSLKQLLPWILALVGAGGGVSGVMGFKGQHDKEIAVLQTGLARVEGKVDTLLELSKRRR